MNRTKSVPFAFGMFVAALAGACSDSGSSTSNSSSSSSTSGDGGTASADSGSGSSACLACDDRKRADPTRRQCQEYFGTDDLRAICAAVESGECLPTKCPDEDLVGVCVMNEGGESGAKFYYYSADWDATSAEDHCMTRDRTAVDGPSATWHAQ